jgi:DNA-binding MarR family transcriptional regulator
MTDQRPIGFWLKLVDRMIDERFASTLEEHGVTRRQWQLLAVLSRGAASVEQLDAAVAPFLSADGETSAEHLGELIESGWVAVAAPVAGPGATYEITERGQTAYTRLAEVVTANRELATEGVSPEEYDKLLGSLRRIAENLGWTDE